MRIISRRRLLNLLRGTVNVVWTLGVGKPTMVRPETYDAASVTMKLVARDKRSVRKK